MTGNVNLRRELDTASAIRYPDIYHETLDRLAREHGHLISMLDDGKDRIARFNCFAYGLGIWEDPSFISVVNRANHSAILQSATVKAMIADSALTEIKPDKARAGDVVIYFDEDAVTHAAVVKGKGVFHSKWGGNEVHAHGLWEVPAAYGDRVRYYRLPSADIVLARLPTTCT